jgi:peptidoglycan hydrolase-like protein with peptidoglycan-binding domain
MVAAVLALLGLSIASAQAQIGPTLPPRPATAPTVPPSATVAPSRLGGASTKRTTVKRAAPKRSTKAASKNAAKSSSRSTKSSKASGFGSGSRGDAVVALQTRLQELHYDISDTEGKFGAQTYHAVMAFQKINGLSRSGRADAKTLAALDSAVDPVPLLPLGGSNRVEIDLRKQYLALYKNGQLDRLLSISSGTGEHFCAFDPDTGKEECDEAITPGGAFKVQNRILGYRESRLGLLYNPVYFNGGIAIHGAASVPAGPASHGCVRIPMVSAEWFPNEVTLGTPVYVFTSDTSPSPLKGVSNTTIPSGAPNGSSTTVPGTAGGSTTTLPGATTTVPGTTTTAPTTTTTAVARLLPGASSTTVATAVPANTAATTTSTAATTTTSTSTTTTAAPVRS